MSARMSAPNNAEPGLGTAAFAPERNLYLHSYLQPLRHWLDDPQVTEILINRPGEVWIERIGEPTMRREQVAAIDDVLLQRLATQIARASHQGINREQPLLAATLPGGERIQIVGPPATRAGWALAIRRHIGIDLRLDDYRIAAGANASGAGSVFPPTLDGLRAAVAARRTVLISGGTSSGKTTLLNAMLREIPAHERVVAVEDTPEIRLHQANSLGLVAVRDEQGEARIDTDALLRAALRLRPDRIVLGELRGAEAVTFLRAINTGHPGSFSTIHANTPQGALQQLALMVVQAGIGLSRADALAYVHGLVDLVVQVGRVDGERRIMAILDVPGSFAA
ncbi:MAG: ATPase, T2SS/T4P/T4SS family [Thermomonas sp.]|uniref:ATPase, T2SS/T4P/T4SS family n=1 Tax=Thermomonas sp. TaxID=1971895 RepID=UPI0039E3FA03